jgi:TatD DNase family protein
MLIDSHCHLDRLHLAPYNGDLDAALNAARERGVQRMLCISIDAGNVDAVTAIAAKHDDIYATVGVHPLDIKDSIETLETLCEWAKRPKVIGIGETGLDYYYSKDNIELQQQSFITHLQAAKQTRKPVIVHTREAKEDTLAIIAEHADKDVSGVLHCFTEDWDMAQRALEMGFYISFSGIITFKSADSLREVVKNMPLDRILVETDSPYLAPVPYRGKKNEPKFVREVAECVAELKGMMFEEVVAQTGYNFNRLFGLS